MRKTDPLSSGHSQDMDWQELFTPSGRLFLSRMSGTREAWIDTRFFEVAANRYFSKQPGYGFNFRWMEIGEINGKTHVVPMIKFEFIWSVIPKKRDTESARILVELEKIAENTNTPQAKPEGTFTII